MRWYGIAARICAGAIAVLTLAVAAYAADFTQPEHTPQFIRNCRRLDRELKDFFNTRFKGNYSFNNMGGFRVLVHREGLERSLHLVPVAQIDFAGMESLRTAARVKSVVVGAVKLSFWQTEPLLPPGDMLLRYDEQHIHWYNSEGLEVNNFPATLTAVPPGAAVDAAQGTLGAADKSLAYVLPDGTLQLYLQLTDSAGKPLKDAAGYQKLLLSCTVPGLVLDDDTPSRELATPGESEYKPAPDNDDAPKKQAPPPGHHH